MESSVLDHGQHGIIMLDADGTFTTVIASGSPGADEVLANGQIIYGIKAGSDGCTIANITLADPDSHGGEDIEAATISIAADDYFPIRMKAFEVTAGIAFCFLEQRTNPENGS